eukprot:11538133-Ditylum_brightwellii.AAC.1
MEIVDKANENDDLEENLEEVNEEDATSSSAMPTVEMDADFEDSNYSDYEYAREDDVHSDVDYTAGEDVSHLSYSWWELGK